jgi:hypothetical protein
MTVGGDCLVISKIATLARRQSENQFPVVIHLDVTICSDVTVCMRHGLGYDVAVRGSRKGCSSNNVILFRLDIRFQGS